MLGARIAALRQRAGLSQSDLASKLMISPSTVGMYEQGRREPSLNTLVSMSEIFDVSVDYLVSGRSADTQALQKAQSLVCYRADRMESRWTYRRVRPFSRPELTVLMAAVLLDA